MRGCHFLSVPLFWQDRRYANISNPGSCGNPSFNIRMGSSWERSKLERICVFMHRKYCWTKRSAESLSKLSKCVAGSALWWLEKTWPPSPPPPKKIPLMQSCASPDLRVGDSAQQPVLSVYLDLPTYPGAPRATTLCSFLVPFLVTVCVAHTRKNMNSVLTSCSRW